MTAVDTRAPNHPRGSLDGTDTVVVTGGAGFIGSALVRRLIRETGATVVNVDALTYAGSVESFGEVADHPRHRFVHADVCDGPAVGEILAVHRPTAIIHLAAESHVDRSIDGPAEFIRTNILGTFTLLRETRRHWQELPPEQRERFRFVHVSTDEVFGSLGPAGFFTEETPYRPNSPYSASKAGADHLVRAWHRTYGLPAIVTHSCNNYGPFQFPEKLIPLMVTKALAGRPLPVYGEGRNVRQWLHAEDHAAALIAVLERGRVGEPYAIAADTERSNMEVVEAVCDLVDELSPDLAVGPRRGLIRFVDDRPGHDFRYAIDASKVRREVGWAPREAFDSGLRRTVRWYIENQDWCARLEARYRGERLGLGASR